MEVKGVNKSPSFGMAWTKESKEVLKRVTSRLNKKEAREVIEIAERLQTSSSNYNLTARGSDILASVKPEYSYPGSTKIFDFVTPGFFRRFKFSTLKAFRKLEEHVKKTNDFIPANKRNYDSISSRIEPLFDKNSEFGFGYAEKEDIAHSLVLLSSKKNGAKRVDTTIEQLFAIDKKAKKQGFFIDFDNFDFDIPTVRISLKQNNRRNYSAPFKLHGDIDKGVKKINAKMSGLIIQSAIDDTIMKATEPVVNIIRKTAEKITKIFHPAKMNSEELSSKVNKIFE